MKKKWDKPEIIALVRSGSEEFVTGICKWPAGAVFDNGPGGYDNDGCLYRNVECDVTSLS